MTPCRWCHLPAVTLTVVVERGQPGEPVGVTFLCGLHDSTARSVALVDAVRRDCGATRVDAIVDVVRMVSA